MMKPTRRAVSAQLAGGLILSASPACAQGQAPLNAAALDTAIAPEDHARLIIPLWRTAPGLPSVRPVETVLERSTPPALRDRAITHVVRPRMVVFRPEHPNGAAVLICPGGGYARVVLDKEGYESAARLNAAGVTCFVLLYRLPGDHWVAGPDAPLQDAQRAIRIIRARATEFAIDPHRVAVMGFSAGGHVAGSLSLRFDAPVYHRVDLADDFSAKPDLSLLLYPVASMEAPYAHAGSREELLGAHPTPEAMRTYSLEHQARADAPATFVLVAADDDTIPFENSVQLFQALRVAHAPCELHVFETGGHGFGIRFTIGKPTAAWPELALNFMRAHHMLGP